MLTELSIFLLLAQSGRRKGLQCAMTGNGAKIILLTGAPLTGSLDWAEESLCCSLQSCFEGREVVEALPPRSKTQPAWRNLPLNVQHLPSGLTQMSPMRGSAESETREDSEETSFLTVTDLSVLPDGSIERLSQDVQSSGSSDSDALTQFYEHSYAVHEELPASDVYGFDSINDKSQFPIDKIDQSDENPSEAEPLTQKIARAKPRSLNATNLRDIPKSSVIRALGPSTMSVDLVVGVLSISQPRMIRTKKYGRLVELVEMIVADDTKSGFGITIWLPILKERNAKSVQEDDLRLGVTRLRPQDIILARNVALNSFKEKVYGQSLRKGVTKLDLLYRNVIDSHDERGHYSWEELHRGIDEPQLARVRALKEWMMSFVGITRTPRIDGDGKDTRSGKQSRPQLPADTQ